MPANSALRDVAILSAVRTPIGRAPKGTLRNTRPDDLGALVVKEALARAEVPASAIEDLVLLTDSGAQVLTQAPKLDELRRNG